MKTLVIGGGNLGRMLVKHYLALGTVDVIARSNSKRSFFEKQGCQLFARDIANSKFHFPMKDYSLVILNAAVTVDRKKKNAKHGLYVKGTAQVLRQLKTAGFSGKLIIVGSTSAVPDFSVPVPSEKRRTPDLLPFMDESRFLDLKVDEPAPSYHQFKLWMSEKEKCKFPIILLMCAGIYGPENEPGHRMMKGLRSTSTNPLKFINLIHREDVARAVFFLESTFQTSDFFFLSDGHPVSLVDIYRSTAKRYNLPAVTFTGKKPQFVSGKKIGNAKILTLGFSLQHSPYSMSL